ncbi:hypothetical protein QFZ27_007695 [Inquilinus ginsengisoli]
MLLEDLGDDLEAGLVLKDPAVATIVEQRQPGPHLGHVIEALGVVEAEILEPGDDAVEEPRRRALELEADGQGLAGHLGEGLDRIGAGERHLIDEGLAQPLGASEPPEIDLVQLECG